MPADTDTPLDFKAIFSATASAYLMLDTNLMIVGVNDAYLLATERTREDVIGRHVFDAFPPNPAEPGSSGIPKLQRSLESVIETGKADRVDFLRFDIPVGPGPQAAFETRYWSPINSPVFNGNGELTHVIHHAIDITSQVESDNARRESERRFNALTEASGVVIYRMNADWSQLDQLEGRGFLRDTAKTGDYRMEDYIPAEYQAAVHDAIQAAIRSKSIFELEHPVMRLDGSIGWTASRAVPILDSDGEILEWIGSAGDITSRKLAEEELKDANRRKDEFLAMLAHELRNPLAPISAAADLLHLGRSNALRVTQISDIIARQVKHMTSLIDDLLDVSRVTRGLVNLAFDTVDVKRVVAEAIEQVEPLVQSRRHHLALHLPPDEALVAGDAKRLVQVITNLLTNAAKYTPEGGQIDLEVQVDQAQVTILVRDNGIGMEAAFLARIFDLFSQAHRNADRAQGGLGIGMALVRSLVTLHRGSILAESQGQGQGSTFTVRLPRFCAAELPQPVPEHGASHAGGSRQKVMVVDDNVDAADVLAMYLEASGHEVIVEHAPRAALARASVEHPTVFLLDIGLPEMNGKELASRLRALPGFAKACLIAVTGYGQEQDRQSTAAAGFDHHFVKPVDMAALTALLEALGGANPAPV